MAIIGTNAGKDVDPAWAGNLRSTPRVRARWDGEWHVVNAVELEGSAHERAWMQAVAVFPGYEASRATLTRRIPIFRLEPIRS